MSPCVECDYLGRPSPEPLLVTARFVVHGLLVPPAVPGWLVIAPARHVEQLDQLTEEELAELGPLAARVGRALRASTPCEKLYLNAFGEQVTHLHLHVIARPPGLPAQERGARLFLAAGGAPPGEVTAVLARVRALLRGAAGASGRDPG